MGFRAHGRSLRLWSLSELSKISGCLRRAAPIGGRMCYVPRNEPSPRCPECTRPRMAEFGGPGMEVLLTANALAADPPRTSNSIGRNHFTLYQTVLSTIAATVGLTLRQQAMAWGVNTFTLAANDGKLLPFWITPALPPISIAYDIGLALLATAVTGILPALKMTKGISSRLRETTAGGGGLKFGGEGPDRRGVRQRPSHRAPVLKEHETRRPCRQTFGTRSRPLPAAHARASFGLLPLRSRHHPDIARLLVQDHGDAAAGRRPA